LPTGRLGLALLQVVEVLDYPARVVDHLVLVDQHGDPPLCGEVVDLVAIAATDRNPDLLVVDPRAAKPAGHLAARAKPVRWRLAAVEDGHAAELNGARSRLQRPQPSDRPRCSFDRAYGARGKLPLDRLGAPRPGETVGLALEVPVHGRLDRVLVRRGRPAELALRLRVPVRPPLARQLDLLRGDRGPARPGLHRLRQPQGDSR